MKTVVLTLLFIFFVFLSFLAGRDTRANDYAKGYENGSFNVATWVKGNGYDGEFPSMGFRRYLIDTRSDAQDYKSLCDELYKFTHPFAEAS